MQSLFDTFISENTYIWEFGMWWATAQKLAVIPQETQSIPDWLSVPTLCYFLLTYHRSLGFHQPHHWLNYLCNRIHAFHTYGRLSQAVAEKEEYSVSVLLPSHLNLSHVCFSARCGGTVGAILTCPLEVVKTRLQSSSITLYVSEVQLSTVNGASVARVSPPGPLHCLKWVLNNIYHSRTHTTTMAYIQCIFCINGT